MWMEPTIWASCVLLLSYVPSPWFIVAIIFKYMCVSACGFVCVSIVAMENRRASDALEQESEAVVSDPVWCQELNPGPL